MKHNNLFIVLFLFFASSGQAAVDLSQRLLYIDTYKDIAILEMHRSGIPASITLAQGILESGWGMGQLAAKSNNHFGIKCKKDWTGKTFYYKDDDLDEQGRLIASCFRSYNSPFASYRDHTDFLVGSDRYAGLFQLGKDYKAWALGLKASGYATAEDYAEKLIRIIEENRLYLYDQEEFTQLVATGQEGASTHHRVVIGKPNHDQKRVIESTLSTNILRKSTPTQSSEEGSVAIAAPASSDVDVVVETSENSTSDVAATEWSGAVFQTKSQPLLRRFARR